MLILKKLQGSIIKPIDENRFRFAKNEYLIRSATIDDVDFLATTIIAAEKSSTNKLSLATLFDLEELTVRTLIVDMLEEEIDGCEYSISSYLVVEYEGTVVAACGGWIEDFLDNGASDFSKSNLIMFTFPKESIQVMMSRAELIKGLVVERKKNCLQLEYLYVEKPHRSKLLELKLFESHIANSLKIYPALTKIQLQAFSSNMDAIRFFERIGFNSVKKYSTDIEVLKYLPHNEKLLMEKIISL